MTHQPQHVLSRDVQKPAYVEPLYAEKKMIYCGTGHVQHCKPDDITQQIYKELVPNEADYQGKDKDYMQFQPAKSVAQRKMAYFNRGKLLPDDISNIIYHQLEKSYNPHLYPKK